MAPFELHTAHIDGLVNAGLQFDVIATRDDATLAGQMLLQQHHRSIGVRRDHDNPPDYTTALADHTFHPVAVLRLLDSYEYQSDETADWNTSPACTWTNRLRDEVLSRLPAETKARVRYGSLSVPAYQLLPAYTDTPWAVTALEQIPGTDDGTIEMPVVCKGLPAEILTGPIHCPNGGLSSRVRHVTILGLGQDRELPAFARVREPSDQAPGVHLLFEHGRYVARPADAPPGMWFAASGAFIHTGDWRWRELIGHRLPIPLHDHHPER
jgi:hypothetical protein